MVMYCAEPGNQPETYQRHLHISRSLMTTSSHPDKQESKASGSDLHVCVASMCACINGV